MTTQPTTPTAATHDNNPDSLELNNQTAYWLGMYRDAQQHIADWTETAKAARAKLEEALGEKTTATIGGHPVLRWTHVKSNRLDQTLLKSLHPDAYRECQTTQTSRRFALVEPTDS